ncbi:MAG: Flp pilus assembly complex ATPase component TadA [Melioribacteraceae bacterium]|nr:Flp pilus assembly complex ATPase component TadA [Melioribacteraceae bacterium]
MKVNEEIVPNESKRLLNSFISKIPKTVRISERITFMIEHFSEIPIEEKYSMIKIMDNLLRYMIEKEASDIEFGGFGTEGHVWFRIYGQKDIVAELPKFSDDESALLILSLMTEKQREKLEKERNLDFSYTIVDNSKKYSDSNTDDDDTYEIRFRVDAYFDVDRLAMNMRSIIPTLRPLEELEFGPEVEKVLSYNYIKQGLVLITGITGSGKSTTLDAIIQWHNNNAKAHITNIAAPLEYVHRSKRCLIRQREVGKDVLSFHEGVVQALRQDLDIMVVGEMRDPATIMAALEVTDTGHKVFSTMHTSSAVESLDRIVAEVQTEEQERVRNRLADVLIAVISQKLVPDMEGKLILAKEVLIITPNVKAAIKNNNTSEIYLMINQGSDLGMITLEQDLKNLYLENKISLENAIQYANNKSLFKQIIGVL